jgi:3-phosphoshikimate 1-carboxyvinyltransferase
MKPTPVNLAELEHLMVAVPGGPLQGTVKGNIPGDKSMSHRAALFAGLADGESIIENFLVSGVTQAMLDALTDLGVKWSLEETTLHVWGKGVRGLQPPEASINCGNSATTLRLLAGALAAAGVPAVLDGSAGLRSRPMKRIVEPLRMMNVPIEATGDGLAPLKLVERAEDEPLKPLNYTLPVASAQVKSCLMLAALAADGSTTLREPGPSRDHTERMLSSMGVEVHWEEKQNAHQQVSTVTTLKAPNPLRLNPLQMSLPGDFSAAAFLIVAALITPGSNVVLQQVGLNPTRTGLLDVLCQMGADIQVSNRSDQGGEPVGDLTIRCSKLKGFIFPPGSAANLVVRMIDEFPVYAVAAAFADGVTEVRDAGELRLKESDRISALVQELLAIGVDIQETRDGFVIRGGGAVRGGSVQAHGDHRLAMALAVAGLASQQAVTIHQAEVVSESFPGFIPTLRALGANLSEAKIRRSV